MNLGCVRASLWLAAFVAAIFISGAAATAQVDSDRNATIQTLLGRLRADSADDYVPALSELKAFVTEEDLPALHEVLKPNASRRLQWRVSRLLGMMRSRASVRPLEALASDSARDEMVRRAALLALGEIGNGLAADTLKDIMTHGESPLLRLQAADAYYWVRGRDGIVDILSAKALEKDPVSNQHFAWYVELCKRGPDITPGRRPGTVSTGAVHGTKYLLYVPEKPGDSPAKVLVAIHGSAGTAEHYMDVCRAYAEAHGLILVVPWFDQAQFPTFDNLNLGTLGLGAARADLRTLEIVDAACDGLSADTQQLYLFGHSRGGQFVQRFVYAHPDRIARAAACGSGLYLTPDPAIKNDYGALFPYGVRPNPLAPDLAGCSMARFAAVPMIVVVGSEDERSGIAGTFMEQVQTTARRDNYPLNFRLKVVSEGRHLGTDNFPAAAEFMFGAP